MEMVKKEWTEFSQVKINQWINFGLQIEMTICSQDLRKLHYGFGFYSLFFVFLE